MGEPRQRGKTWALSSEEDWWSLGWVVRRHRHGFLVFDQTGRLWREQVLGQDMVSSDLEVSV